MDYLLNIAVSNAVAATVLALLALAVRAVYRRPALVHGMWLLVLLKLVTPPLVYLPIVWPAATETSRPEVASVPEEPVDPSPTAVEEQPAFVIVPPAGERGVVSAPRASTTPNVEDPPNVEVLGALTPPRSVWPQILRIVWGVGALAWFLLALERLHHFRRLLRFSRPAPAALQERTRRLAQSLGLTRCPRVRLLPGRIAPMLWAVGGPPRLLVPADLLDKLNDDQLDTLLLHELAHLRRRDHWVRILEFVVMGLYWWHPVVWYARRELREAEEQCCDAWVVSTLPGTGRTYASALLDTLDFLSTAQAAVPPLASGLSEIADLKRRLTMIMGGKTPRSLTWPGCLAVVALGLTFLPMLPTLHGQQPSKDELGKVVNDDQDAQRAFEKARADLERQKARLEEHKANLARAEAELKKAIAAMEQQKKIQLGLEKAQLQRQVRIAALNQIGQKKRDGKSTLHIEIVVNDEDINVKDVVKKLNEMFAKQGADIRINVDGKRTNEMRFRNTPPRADFTPNKPLEPQKAPRSPQRGEDKRINELEKKLDKMMRELQDLRRQMRQSRSGASDVPPGLHTPAAAGPTPVSKPPRVPSNNPYSAPAAPPAPTPATTPPAVPAAPEPADAPPPVDPTRP